METPYHNSVAPRVGRLLLCLIFLISGISQIFNFGPTANHMGNVGLPMPEILVIATLLIKVMSGMLYLWAFGSGAFSFDNRDNEHRDHLH